MLAIAVKLAGFQGVVIVISPLKSLQKDQVSMDLTRFQE
jgi:superfamily II DNA helicase RecQ